MALPILQAGSNWQAWWLIVTLMLCRQVVCAFVHVAAHFLALLHWVQHIKVIGSLAATLVGSSLMTLTHPVVCDVLYNFARDCNET